MTSTSATTVTAIRAVGPAHRGLHESYFLAHRTLGDSWAVAPCGLTALWMPETILIDPHETDVALCATCFPEAAPETTEPKPEPERVESILRRYGVPEADIGAACADLTSSFERFLDPSRRSYPDC